jgi:excisionase family DNA binding protein
LIVSSESLPIARCLLSVDEAAQYLGVSPGTLRNWLSMRRLEFVKVGRLTRVSQVALDRHIAAHTVREVDTE